MKRSRRNFMYRAGIMTAGSFLIQPVLLSSCQPSGKTGYVRMGFIGSGEHFRYFQPVFRKLRRADVELISLEDALKSDFNAVFLAGNPNTKPVNTILLLERGKDVITPYPLAGSLGEYNKIQEYMARYNRRLGMMNPLQFYPAIRTLKDWLFEETLTGIRVNCHPRQVVSGYSVSGLTGAVQPLQRIISYITGKFPLTLLVTADEQAGFQRYVLDYGSFLATIEADPGQTGWILEVEGPRLNAMADHTGLLRLDDEVEPRISPSPSVLKRAMIRNMEDFLHAIRTREEPEVNSLDGLAAIILNQAAGRSLHDGTKVDL